MTNGKPRRRSIFGGLLLVIVGVLFLLHNFGYWHYDAWRVVGHWWPLLLILWGLAKLYDHLRAQNTGEAGPATISGGEIFLVFLVLLIFGGVGFVDFARSGRVDLPGWNDNGPWAPWERTYTFNVDLPAKAIPASSHITIQTDRGDITIHPEDAAEIRVAARKTIGGSDEEDAKKRGDQTNVSIEQTGNSFEVRTLNQGEDNGRARVDLEVHVPKQASLTIRGGKGNLQVIGMSGNVIAETRSGDVEVRDAGGDVSVDVSRGDTHIVGAAGNVKLSGRGSQVTIADVKGEAAVDGEFFGPIRIEKAAKGARFLSKRTDLTISQLTGRFSISSGRLEVVDAPGNVTLITSSNDVSLENVTGRIHVENRNGNVEARLTKTPADSIDITNASGNVDFVVPSSSTFELHASARSGETYSDFPELSKDSRQVSGNATMDGKLGVKGPVVNLKTTYGSIRVRKAD